MGRNELVSRAQRLSGIGAVFGSEGHGKHWKGKKYLEENTDKEHLLASICITCGSASRTLFLYTAGPFVCSGFPSKYTVFKFSLSLSSCSTSSKLDSWLFDAHSSSRRLRCEMFSSLEIWLLEKSRTRSFVLFSSPDRLVMALCEM